MEGVTLRGKPHIVFAGHNHIGLFFRVQLLAQFHISPCDFHFRVTLGQWKPIPLPGTLDEFSRWCLSFLCVVLCFSSFSVDSSFLFSLLLSPRNQLHFFLFTKVLLSMYLSPRSQRGYALLLVPTPPFLIPK